MRAPDAQAAVAAADAEADEVAAEAPDDLAIASDATDAAGLCLPGHHLLSYTDFTSATKL